jgi:hypothetical protein
VKPIDPSPRALFGADTDPAIEQMLIQSWRSMSAGARLSRALAVSAAVAALARAGAQARTRTPFDAWIAYAAARLRRDLAEVVRRQAHSEPTPDGSTMEHLQVVMLVVDALERCGSRYVVGGSLASAVAGEPRATIDADIMIDLAMDRVSCLVAALGDDFHADAVAIERAIRDRSHANVVHRPTATKIDLFVMGATPIEAEQMRRRRLIALESPPVELYVYTPEDILLQKLRWFRLGGEASDRQWRDVLGIVAVQGGRLDLEYLRSSADAISVRDLLERALGSV